MLTQNASVLRAAVDEIDARIPAQRRPETGKANRHCRGCAQPLPTRTGSGRPREWCATCRPSRHAERHPMPSARKPLDRALVPVVVEQLHARRSDPKRDDIHQAVTSVAERLDEWARWGA